MSLLSAPLRDSLRLLRGVLLLHWLGASVIIALFLAGLNLFNHQQQLLIEGEQAAHLVTSLLRTPLSNWQRQKLLEVYGESSRQFRLQGMNLLLVLNDSGHIVYSSRSAWTSLTLSDPLFEQLRHDDRDLQAVADCFRADRNDCMRSRLSDWSLPRQHFSVVRQVWMPARDIGLQRQPYLVVVNFDPGMVMADVLQDLPPYLLLAAVIATLLSGALWFALSLRFLSRISQSAQTDALTQLMNRTSFMELALDLLAQAEEQHAELVFAILDIDHFKRINDTYGHSCGDAALASVGTLLLTVTRPEDLVCRFGGEEFALLISTSHQAGGKMLERLRLQLEMNKLRFNGQQIPLTASIGAVATSTCGYNLDYLYNAADKALYAAKQAGRNRLEWNTGQLNGQLSGQLNSQLGGQATGQRNSNMPFRSPPRR